MKDLQHEYPCNEPKLYFHCAMSAVIASAIEVLWTFGYFVVYYFVAQLGIKYIQLFLLCNAFLCLILSVMLCAGLLPLLKKSRYSAMAAYSIAVGFLVPQVFSLLQNVLSMFVLDK